MSNFYTRSHLGTFEIYMGKCSCCGQLAAMDNFCGNCGARMNEVRDDEGKLLRVIEYSNIVKVKRK